MFQEEKYGVITIYTRQNQGLIAQTLESSKSSIYSIFPFSVCFRGFWAYSPQHMLAFLLMLVSPISLGLVLLMTIAWH